MILNALKANNEISRLKKVVTDITADRDLQLTKLKEFEDTNKDYIESAETASKMKSKHKQEVDLLNKQIETLKTDYELKLSAKDKEVESAKNDIQARVVHESIALVASQGTNVMVDSVNTNSVLTPEQAYQRLQTLTGEAKQKFYEQNAGLFMSLLKKR